MPQVVVPPPLASAVAQLPPPPLPGALYQVQKYEQNQSRLGFWIKTFLALSGTALLLLILLLAGLLNGGLAGVAAAFFALLPVPLYLALVLYLDRFEPEPRSYLAGLFVYGALVAFPLSSGLQSLLGGPILDAFPTGDYRLLLLAPWIEECAKASGLFLLFLFRRKEIDGMIDGIIYASMVGLGFALMKNLYFYAEAVQMGMGFAVKSILLRGVVAPFSQPLFSAMVGIGLGLAVRSGDPLKKILYPLGGLGAAIVAHFLWNLPAALPYLPVFLIVYLLFAIPLFGGVVWLLLRSSEEERLVVAAQLQPYSHNGTLTDHEYLDLASPERRVRGLVHAWRKRGFKGWRHLRSFQHVATELAFLRHKTSPEHYQSPGFLRQESTLLSRLQEIRSSAAQS